MVLSQVQLGFSVIIVQKEKKEGKIKEREIKKEPHIGKQREGRLIATCVVTSGTLLLYCHLSLSLSLK